MLDEVNALLRPDVTDVFISSDGVWARSFGKNYRLSWSPGEAEVRDLAAELVGLGGRHIDDATPYADVALNGGIRVHAVLHPMSVRGTSIAIRVPRPRIPRLSDFEREGAITQRQAAELRADVHNRKTFLVTGAAGAGKTTLLAALMSEVDEGERIVSLEDVAELRIEHPHVVSLEVRQANADGYGHIALAELVRQSLRMRPDRLVLGECRGVEVLDMFSAFTTGHDGGGATLHARSLDEIPARLGAIAASMNAPAEVLTRLAASAIDRVCHVSIVNGERRVSVGRFESRDDIGLSVRVAPVRSS